MLEATEIYALLEVRRKAMGLSQTDVSLRAFGRAENSALQNLRRGSSPSVEKLAALASVLGLEMYFGKPRQRAFLRMDEDPTPTPLTGLNEAVTVGDLPRAEALRGSYLPIPWHPSQRRAESVPVALSREWMARTSIIPDNLVAVEPAEARFEAFGPMIAVIDTLAARAGGPHLWCYQIGGRVVVARLQFDQSRAMVVPMRSDDRIEVLKPSDQLLGRAVWFGQKVD